MLQDSLYSSLQWFDTISLQQLNSSASLLERSETKYIIHTSQLVDLIASLKPSFSILTINGKEIFSYQNIYIDSDEYHCYNMHQSGGNEKWRYKIRTRHYVDSDVYFCEFKHKKWKQLSKFRYQCTENEHGIFTDESREFCNGIYESVFKETLPENLTPALNNSYKRITLCSKDFSEKMTIDVWFKFYDPRNKRYAKLENIAIVESKATTQPAFTAPMFEELWITSAKACSKYCLGLILTKNVDKYSHFQHTLAHINSLQTNYKHVSTKKALKSIEEISSK